MKIKSPPLLLAVLALSVFSTNPILAEDVTAYPHFILENTELRTLPTSANGMDYLIYVALPASYTEETAKIYPVYYALDGYWDFDLVNAFHNSLVYDKVTPEFIVVGIGYQGENPNYGRLRRSDYSPVPDSANDPDGKSTGNGKAFLGVIEKEIIPFIESEYRADSSYRLLGGSSMGGLFTLYALFENPDLFTGYLASSPAVGWDNRFLFNFEKEYAAKHSSLNARLFMSGGSEEWDDFITSIKHFNRQLQKRSYEGFHYKWKLIEGEAHAGVKAESFTRGMRFLFEPRKPE